MLASVPMPIRQDLAFEAPQPLFVNPGDPRTCQLSHLPHAASSAFTGQLILNMSSGKTYSSEPESTHPAKMATSTSAQTNLVQPSMQHHGIESVSRSHTAGASRKTMLPSSIELINHNGISSFPSYYQILSGLTDTYSRKFQRHVLASPKR